MLNCLDGHDVLDCANISNNPEILGSPDNYDFLESPKILFPIVSLYFFNTIFLMISTLSRFYTVHIYESLDILANFDIIDIPDIMHIPFNFF